MEKILSTVAVILRNNMRNKKFSFIVKIALLFLPALFSTGSFASDYSPPGLYDVEHLTLDNGLDVILKPRQGAHTFSVRVWTGVGTQDYACEQQETPHFLEHLLFTGTSNHTEAELEHLVADHGGSWNATTGVEATVYEMDIYSRHADFAINTLFEIITDSSITEENVETSRDIIHREAGGTPSKIKKWFRSQGFGINATQKAVRQLLPDTNFICDEFVTAENITRDDIINAYNKYYVPGNMALIAVGDFDKKELVKQIQNTFGTITKQSVSERVEPKTGEVSSYAATTGTLSPLLSDDANIGVMYRLPDYWSDDHYPLMIIEEYLYFKISEIIRIERGLAYAPSTWSYATGQFGLFGAYADVNLDDIDEALSLIKSEISTLHEQPMNVELLEKSKLKILLQNVQGYESNANIADYYAIEYVRFRKNHYYENTEEKIEAVTVDDISRVVKEYLSEDKAVTLIETPTLTYTQFYVVLTFLLTAVVTVIIVFYMRARARYKKR